MNIFNDMGFVHITVTTVDKAVRCRVCANNRTFKRSEETKELDVLLSLPQ